MSKDSLGKLKLKNSNESINNISNKSHQTRNKRHAESARNFIRTKSMNDLQQKPKQIKKFKIDIKRVRVGSKQIKKKKAPKPKPGKSVSIVNNYIIPPETAEERKLKDSVLSTRITTISGLITSFEKDIQQFSTFLSEVRQSL